MSSRSLICPSLTQTGLSRGRMTFWGVKKEWGERGGLGGGE